MWHFQNKIKKYLLVAATYISQEDEKWKMLFVSPGILDFETTRLIAQTKKFFSLI